MVRRLALVVAVALAAGCSSPSPDAEVRSTEPADSTEAATAPSVLSGSEVLDRLRGSVALVETPAGSGTAIVLADGHLVTNAHVVDPFRRVTVTLDDGDAIDVDVVGVDLIADVAVLGPLPNAAPDGVELEDPADLASGADLFLIGHPGGVEDPEVTIARGVLSRRRQVEPWGIDLLQTDAAIAAGQSGGAVADPSGRVVGLSGYSLDEEFALALTGPAVGEAVTGIIDGPGSDHVTLPPLGEARDTGATLDTSASGEAAVLVPNIRDAPELEVRTDPAVPVELLVTDLASEPIALNEAYDEFLRGGEEGFDGPAPTDPDEPGVWTFDIAIDEPVLLFVAATDGRPEVAIETSQRISVLTPPAQEQRVAIGDEVDGTVGIFDDTDVYALDLDAGTAVTITARSPFGDMALTLVPPGSAEVVDADDGGGGLFDLDATVTFSAEEDGRHLLYVSQVDGFATGYRLEVEPA